MPPVKKVSQESEEQAYQGPLFEQIKERIRGHDFPNINKHGILEAYYIATALDDDLTAAKILNKFPKFFPAYDPDAKAKLIVKVHKAQNLRDADFQAGGGRSDPFVKVIAGPNDSEVHSQVIHNNSNPEWNEQLEEIVGLPLDTTSFKIQLWDWDPAGEFDPVNDSNFLGEIVVDLASGPRIWCHSHKGAPLANAGRAGTKRAIKGQASSAARIWFDFVFVKMSNDLDTVDQSINDLGIEERLDSHMTLPEFQSAFASRAARAALAKGDACLEMHRNLLKISGVDLPVIEAKNDDLKRRIEVRKMFLWRSAQDIKEERNFSRMDLHALYELKKKVVPKFKIMFIVFSSKIKILFKNIFFLHSSKFPKFCFRYFMKKDNLGREFRKEQFWTIVMCVVGKKSNFPKGGYELRPDCELERVILGCYVAHARMGDISQFLAVAFCRKVALTIDEDEFDIQTYHQAAANILESWKKELHDGGVGGPTMRDSFYKMFPLELADDDRGNTIQSSVRGKKARKQANENDELNKLVQDANNPQDKQRIMKIQSTFRGRQARKSVTQKKELNKLVEEKFGEQNFRVLSEMRILAKNRVVILDLVG